MMDVHEYQVFSPAENAMSWDEHISTACSKKGQYASFDLWTVVGEWTLAFTDCAGYLNGRGVGARYDGSYPGSSYIGNCAPWTGNGNAFSSDYKAFLRKFWEAQVTGMHSFFIISGSDRLIHVR
jgi:glucan 1,3-beta-glucosidase